MAIPIKNVVMSKKAEDEINARIKVIAPIIAIETAIVRSIPHRTPNRAANGAKIPMRNTGIVVKKLTVKLLISRSYRMVSSNGVTDTIAGRKLTAVKKRLKRRRPFWCRVSPVYHLPRFSQAV